MLNLPSQPGTTGTLLLALGAVGGLLLVLLGRQSVGEQLGPDRDPLLTWVVTATLGVTLAGAPFTLWRVFEDIHRTAPISAEHARYVGAETARIDGELVEEIARLIPEHASYHVAVSPDAFVQIRESLGLWMGFALLPRPRVRDASEADWIVTWGATPAQLGLDAGEPRLIGRNRLVDREPVYLSRGFS